MRKTLLIIAMLTLLPLVSFSQDYDKKKVQLLVGVAVTEITREQLQNITTATFDGKYHVYNKSGLTISPSFSFSRTSYEIVLPHYDQGMHNYIDIKRDVNRYFVGAEVAKQFRIFVLGGGFFLGTTKLHEDFDYQYLRKIRVFAELLPFGRDSHLVIRLINLDNTTNRDLTRTYTNYTNSYGSSIGLRF